MDGPQRRNRAGEDARERILRAATIRFARLGYDATTIADIAADIGKTDAGVLHHFPTKRALHAAISDPHTDPFVRALSTPCGTLSELIARLSSALTESLANPDIVRFNTMTSGEALALKHPLHDHYVASETENIQAMTSRISECQDAPGDTDPRDLAIQLIALVRGLRAEWALVGGEIDVPSLFRAAADQLVARQTT